MSWRKWYIDDGVPREVDAGSGPGAPSLYQGTGWTLLLWLDDLVMAESNWRTPIPSGTVHRIIVYWRSGEEA